MEMAQLCKSSYGNNYLQKSISLFTETYVSKMAGEHTLTEPKLKVTP